MTEEHFTLLKLFGAVVIKDAVKDLTPIITAYDSAVFKKIGSDTPLNFVQGKIPACAFALEENSELRMLLLDAYSANFLSQSKNRLLYWGSDLSTFRSSSGWHRDQNSTIPFIKVLLYLSNSFGAQQSFLYFPGSHHCSDSYSKNLTQILDWPVSTELKPSQSLNGLVRQGLYQGTVTFSVLKINPGDIIVFDSRVIHAVEATPELRRLVAVSFCGNMNGDFWNAADYTAFQRDLIKLKNLERFSNLNDFYQFLLLSKTAYNIVESNMHNQDFPYVSKGSLGSELGSMYPLIDLHQEDFEIINQKIFRNDMAHALTYVNQYA